MLQIEKKINELIGKFAFHLYDTHGIPKQIFLEQFSKDGYWDFIKIIDLMHKHKDFIKGFLKKKI